ncbi:MAG: DnaB-like helicase N-terminal domain-containing protein [Oscillospiraceae bacterium]
MLAALLKNPDYYGEISGRISPAQFVTDSNRALFGILCERLGQGQSIELMSLSRVLSEEQMGRLSYLLASTGEQSFTIREVADFIEVILSKAAETAGEQVGSMDERELKNFIDGIAAKKK